MKNPLKRVLSIGGYNSAWLDDLVTCYILEKMKPVWSDKFAHFKIYCDNGCGLARNTTVNKLCKWYSWIADQLSAHKKLICQRTRRTTTIPRPPLESSWREKIRSTWYIFVRFNVVQTLLGKLYWKGQKNDNKKLNPEELVFPSPRAFQWWSRNCRSASGSLENCFLSARIGRPI